MGTSITLTGRLRVADPLATLEPVLAAPGPLGTQVERGTDEEGRPLIAAALHPAAEPLRVVDRSEGRIAIEAITGTAGPGYHAHVCARIAGAIEACGITVEHVDDESGYFASRDRGAVENATLQWLRPTAMEILSLHARGYRGLQLSMPAGTIVEHAGIVATPLGPRDHGWLERVARDPRAGIDALPWWAPDEDAAMLRGAALAAMWLDVRWRKPLVQRERSLLERVDGWLERALRLDPEGAHPWREHSEILELVGEDSLRATRIHLRAANLPPAPPIGYRRAPVRVAVADGWTVRIPGELAEEWDERGAWSAWDARRSIWITSLEARGSSGSAATLAGLPELEGEGDLLAFERGGIHALARFETSEDDRGQIVTTMRAHAAFSTHALVGTIVLERASDRDWALETWASLAHVEDRAT